MFTYTICTTNNNLLQNPFQHFQKKMKPGNGFNCLFVLYFVVKLRDQIPRYNANKMEFEIIVSLFIKVIQVSNRIGSTYVCICMSRKLFGKR